MNTDANPRLKGVHHTARPTWKLRETIEFYRDRLGLPLVHCVSAKGWGPSDHPDFLHFFFDAGNGALIAFFYYLGTTQPAHLVHHAAYDSDATHTAWKVDSREELMAWRRRLEDQGVEIMFQIEHEVVESIYFRDPNGYFVEIGTYVRDLEPLDVSDAELTLRVAMEEEARLGHPLRDIESLYRAKGRAVERLLENEP